MSLLVICESLGLFIKPFTAKSKYFRLDRESLPQPIQMQISKKTKSFFSSFSAFLNFAFNFKYFEKKKITFIANIFPKLRTAKDLVRKMPKKPCFRTPFNSQHFKESQKFLKSALQDF